MQRVNGPLGRVVGLLSQLRNVKDVYTGTSFYAVWTSRSDEPYISKKSQE